MWSVRAGANRRLLQANSYASAFASGQPSQIAQAMAQAASSDSQSRAFASAAAQAYQSSAPGLAQAYGSALATTAGSNAQAAASAIEQAGECEYHEGLLVCQFGFLRVKFQGNTVPTATL